ncbi:SAM-dependent methyltransferase [Ancylobacter sp. 6x-1]|uniref:SAM-dependent methyltransferase n=1 Tax=Ancylobacter crimeensis TaxID=2579147 RepID=A0ABT0D9R3_9HYPH|nr:SAM-dependent methyltransferase [Ancylobacter crimeensis]MCK0196677.1 SAM-dependent methyltransferase [Ancylobacter crimeensis]
MTTPLGTRIAALIEAGGAPLSVEDYMRLCLLDPVHGYYTTAEPFGRSGDFITAPEISQMFGELLGLWAADAWMRLGSPSPFILAELGPGRGTLMSDALRATRIVPGFREAARIVLVEASPRLRERQAQTLAPEVAHVGVEWVQRIEELPQGPLILLANEFIDALPVRQFVRTQHGIAERMVGIDGRGGLRWGLVPSPARPDVVARLETAEPGAVLEICPAGETVAAVIGARIARDGGAALLVDYGHAGGFGDTLQALWRQAPDEPLAHPGEADLTAHVDFAALARHATAAGARAFGPIGQGELLLRLGLARRAERLARNADAMTREAIAAAANRLAGSGPEGMGELFKALALVHPSLSEIAGFATGEAFADTAIAARGDVG